MSQSHNKKRNVGIIYELLIRHIANELMNDNKSVAEKALSIVERRFDKSTELYKEFRLFNALVRSTVSNTPVAAAILSEAKQASRRCDLRKLDREKSWLIKDINHILDDKNFYHKRIPEYRMYATIQTLLNEWRLMDRSDLSKVVQYESKVVEWLLKEKVDDDIHNSKVPETDALIVKIMTEKFNKRFGSTLNSEQKNIIKSYVFSLAKDNGDSIKKMLSEIKNEMLPQIDEFKKKTDNTILLEKISNVRERITDVNPDIISDDTISKFLTISHLKYEISGALNE